MKYYSITYFIVGNDWGINDTLFCEDEVCPLHTRNVVGIFLSKDDAISCVESDGGISYNGTPVNIFKYFCDGKSDGATEYCLIEQYEFGIIPEKRSYEERSNLKNKEDAILYKWNYTENKWEKFSIPESWGLNNGKNNFGLGIII